MYHCLTDSRYRQLSPAEQMPDAVEPLKMNNFVSAQGVAKSSHRVCLVRCASDPKFTSVPSCIVQAGGAMSMLDCDVAASQLCGPLLVFPMPRCSTLQLCLKPFGRNACSPVQGLALSAFETKQRRKRRVDESFVLIQTHSLGGRKDVCTSLGCIILV